jgi:RNA polymerase sigma factor, sigma-70 family
MRDPLPESYTRRVEQLYDEYKNVMLNTAMSIVKDTTQAEDIVQFAFIKIIKHIEKIDKMPYNELKGYIVLVIKNLAIDYIRKCKQEHIVPIENVDYSNEEGISVENIAIANLELGRVKESLKVMDDKYSLPLILKYSLGFTHAEIAEMLDISAETVKVRCHRGKRMLADAIGREASE